MDKDYKRLANVIKGFANIDILAYEIEELGYLNNPETIDELTEFLEGELSRGDICIEQE